MSSAINYAKKPYLHPGKLPVVLLVSCCQIRAQYATLSLPTVDLQASEQTHQHVSHGFIAGSRHHGLSGMNKEPEKAKSSLIVRDCLE